MPTEPKPRYELSGTTASFGRFLFNRGEAIGTLLTEEAPDILHRLNTWDAMREALEEISRETISDDAAQEDGPSNAALKAMEALTTANQKPQ